jgi:hypothetical protein
MEAFGNDCTSSLTLTGFFDARLTVASGDLLSWQITAKATPLPGGTGRGIPNVGEYYYYVGCLAY